MKSHPLDAEHPMNGAFVDLEEQNQKRIQELINEFATKPQQKGSLGQKIGSIYNLMMDSVRLNREGAAPLKPYLAKVDAIEHSRVSVCCLFTRFRGHRHLDVRHGCGRRPAQRFYEHCGH